MRLLRHPEGVKKKIPTAEFFGGFFGLRLGKAGSTNRDQPTDNAGASGETPELEPGRAARSGGPRG